ncbi:MAG: heme-binding protein [Burkholderiales bacterium]
MKITIKHCIVAFVLALAVPVQAQKLLSTFSSLTTGAAQKAAQAAFDKCSKDGYTVAVAVVDRGGVPLVVLRDNLAGAHTVNTAIGKAWSAVSFRTDTNELASTTQAGKPQSGIRDLPNVVAVAGGMMVQAKGGLVGGIGVSGAPGGDIDDVCAKAGLAAISDSLELE